MAETIPPVEHVKSLLDQLGGSSGPIPEGNPSQLGGKLEQRLQDVGSALAKFFTHGGLNVSDYTPVQAPAYKDYLPKNKLGQTPEEYVQNPADKTAPEGPITPTITDKEFETLQNESAKGNHFAMQLLDAYKPKYGLTAYSVRTVAYEPDGAGHQGFARSLQHAARATVDLRQPAPGCFVPGRADGEAILGDLAPIAECSNVGTDEPVPWNGEQRHRCIDPDHGLSVEGSWDSGRDLGSRRSRTRR